MSIFDNTKVAFQRKSNYQLRKAHALFKTVDINWLTNFGAWSLPWAIYIPGVKSLMKYTVFEHFCGGETRQESLQTVNRLFENQVSSILDYSVEGKEEESEYENCFKEILAIIDTAKGNEKIPFVVFKPSGFGNIQIYTKVSAGHELTPIEQNAWKNIQRRFDSVCKKAYDNDVTIMVDAEESWMQPAADAMVEDLMKKYNQERCIVVNTLQMYRHDRLAYLHQQYENAEKEDYRIGYKIVRGAYMEKERERAKEKGYSSPIQSDKASTDHDYNEAIKFITRNTHRVSLFAGTHNEHSCKLLMDYIEESNLTKQNHQVWFGQLLGMSDNISFVLADMGYNVAKYVPYGPVKDVLPYLIRRAQENTSVAGQSSRELSLIEQELKRRKKAD